MWPVKKLAGFLRSLHPVQMVGFLIGGGELVGLLFGRPIDKEVMPFAAALVVWGAADRYRRGGGGQS